MQPNVEKVSISNKEKKKERKTYMKLETCPLCRQDCCCHSVVIEFVGILGAMVVVVVVVVMLDVSFCRPLMVPVVTTFSNYFYFLHTTTSCYMRIPHVVYFYF